MQPQQQEGERLLAANPARRIFPQGVFQGAKTVDWIAKPWTRKPQSGAEQAPVSPSSSAEEEEHHSFSGSNAQRAQPQAEAGLEDQRQEHWERLRMHKEERRQLELDKHQLVQDRLEYERMAQQFQR